MDKDKEQEYYKCLVGLMKKKGYSKGRAAAVCKAVVFKEETPGIDKKKDKK